ncbi:MAG TPA: hypothetical protein DDW51_12245 [Cyanobacteria bacterium UBA11367]|nr:hypothetical protein [Cyanobacteria bacterium UBA11367]
MVAQKKYSIKSIGGSPPRWLVLARWLVPRSQVPPGNAVLEALPPAPKRGSSPLYCVTRPEPGNEATRRK